MISVRQEDCVAALSETALLNVYSAADRGAWFRKREPDARIGYSIYLYDLRQAGKTSSGRGHGSG